MIEDDEEIREMINDYLSGEFEVTSFNDGMTAIRGITSYDEYALRFVELRKLKILEELQRMLKNRVLGNLFSMCVYFMLHCTKNLEKITGHDKIPVYQLCTSINNRFVGYTKHFAYFNWCKLI